uniref:Uncharacterized protein n=1 Tax=Globodera rostochiensis TaxID=31243 RepID=A0A914HM22_GLORO
MAAPAPFRADSNSQQYTPSLSVPSPIYYRDTFGLQQQQMEEAEGEEDTKIVGNAGHSFADRPSLIYPPPLYYRDTFGLEPLAEDENNLHAEERISVGSDETATTKSTVRHTIRIFHPEPSVPGPTLNRLLLIGQRRKQSGFSGVISQQQQQQQQQHPGHDGTGHESLQQSDISHSMQIEEQLSTNQILLVHLRPLQWLFAVGFGTALQLLIFSVVCLFFDGNWLGSVVSVLLLLHSVLVLLHLRLIRIRPMLTICIVLSGTTFVLSLFLFICIAYLIHMEDVRIRNAEFDITNPQAELERSNQIVQNARLAMYSLLLIYAPIYAICAFAMFFLLLKNYAANGAGRSHKGFFLTSPSSGHQRVLRQQQQHQQQQQREDDQQRGKEAKGRKKRTNRRRRHDDHRPDHSPDNRRPYGTWRQN